jgi:hypothetical protein
LKTRLDGGFHESLRKVVGIVWNVDLTETTVTRKVHRDSKGSEIIPHHVACPLNGYSVLQNADVIDGSSA